MTQLQTNTGWQILLKKEILRFWRVALQTIAAPLLTAALYLLIFSHVFQGRVQVYENISYIAFLAPGLIMMSVLQNSFANSASSLVQAKIMGNLIFQLLTPLTAYHWFIAYTGAAILRGLAVGISVYIATLFFHSPQAHSIIWIAIFTILGAGIMGVLGIIAGLWADKFDQMATFQNFIIMPLTFLSGVFYSINNLPPIWRTISHLNPFFYLIDGLRYGFFGQSDTSPIISLTIAIAALIALSTIAIYLLKTGYKLRN